MNRAFKIAGGIACALFSLVSVPAWGQIPCSYELTHVIEAPPCGSSPAPTIANGMSPNGRYVCGVFGCISGGGQAFVFDTETTEFIEIPFGPGFLTTEANDVGDDGRVSGGGTKVEVGLRAFVYEMSTGIWTELPPQNPLVGWSSGTSMNSSGAVCGYRSLDDGGDPVHPWNGFVWTPKDGIVDLGAVVGIGSRAVDLNDSGMIVGFTGGSGTSPQSRAVIWTAQGPTILPPVPNGQTSAARAVNASGQVVITGQVGSPTVSRAFLWERGNFTDIGVLEGYEHTGASNISDAGTIIGRCTDASLPQLKANFIWHKGVMQNLDDLVLADPTEFAINVAAAINSKTGQIVGEAAGAKAYSVGFVLSPKYRKQGDTNCDDLVNVDDLIAVIQAWGPCQGCNEDFTDDQQVNVVDLIVVLDQWTF